MPVWKFLPAPHVAHPQVFRAAVDLKQRDLVTECLLLLLPQFGSPTADSTGEQQSPVGVERLQLKSTVQRWPLLPWPRAPALPLTWNSAHACGPSAVSPAAVSEVIDYMDATLSKVVLTQVRCSWMACCTVAKLWLTAGKGCCTATATFGCAVLTRRLPSPPLPAPQLAMHGSLPTAAVLRRRSSSASSRSGSSGPASEAGVSEGSISISPCSQYEGTAVECTTPRTGRASSFSGISRRSSRSYEAERAASVSAGNGGLLLGARQTYRCAEGRVQQPFCTLTPGYAQRALLLRVLFVPPPAHPPQVDALKRRFVETLESKGWGM